MCKDISSLLFALASTLKRYEVNTELCAGIGRFGIVVPGEDIVLKKEVAFKVECGMAITRNEIAAYKALKGISGIPEFYEAVTFRGHGVLIIELLGSNLNTFMCCSGVPLSISAVYILGRQLVRIVEQMHRRGVIHRDIKPNNILLPKSGELKPYLVDFGLANPFEERRRHRGREVSLTCCSGTPSFMSQAAHQGKPSSYRDDIESLVYTLIYLAHGSLPWYDLCKSECMRQKSTFQVSQLQPPLPQGLQLFLNHAISLQYAQIPNYSLLEELLR